MTKQHTSQSSKGFTSLDDLNALTPMSMIKLFVKYPEVRSFCKTVRRTAAFEGWAR